MSGPARTLTMTATAVLLAAALTGCSGTGSPTCGDFNAMSEAEQGKVLAQWHTRDFENEPGDDAIVRASLWRKDMITYCADHPDDSIADLQITVG